MGNVLDALDDAKIAIERSTNASADIKDILIRLEKEIHLRLEIDTHKLTAESMDTITDL